MFVHAVLNCLLIAVYKENSTKDAICKKNIVERSSCDRVFLFVVSCIGVHLNNGCQCIAINLALVRDD